MNLLVIEDNKLISDNIKKLFKKKDILNRIRILSSYNYFLRELHLVKSYDIILVDILLWDKNKNWIDIIKIIRKENKSIPIIIISWLNDIAWIERWFSIWASDYILKPFRLKELEIRIYKWFKIYFYSDKSNSSKWLEYCWLKYNISDNSFYFKDNKISLTKWNKYLLKEFISNKEILLSNKLLIEKIWWDIENLINRNLRIRITRLKKELNPFNLDNWIHNIRGEWYIFKKL